MTKVDAIKKVMEDNRGTATWAMIYDNIEKYYPTAKVSVDWEAGIRGVLYREIKNKRNFKKIGFGIYALADYDDKKEKISEKDPIKMHSYVEGICIELGNYENYNTYTADPSAKFKDNIFLSNLSTLKTIPEFTYQGIISTVKRIDVLWFNKDGLLFPKRAFEIVDSIGTLGEAFNRTYQIGEFNLDFYIIGTENNRGKFEDKRNKEPYIRAQNRYIYKSYDEIVAFYTKKLELETLKIFR
jgi:hypothetical protein